MNKHLKKNDKLLLHICCAPCSTYPIEILRDKYAVTAFFFNPNIFPPSEYNYRLEESQRYLFSINLPLLSPSYNRQPWLNHVRNLGNEREGGVRCYQCFQFRLEETAKHAEKQNFQYFSTTLTIGPNKPASVIFPIGKKIALNYNLTFLEIDFKKRDGFKHSCRLSKENNMYRQNYCGCEYSLRDRNIRISNRLQLDSLP
ncbi:epoxyqueuosine reductase QueH [bacterium]|nr:epoxyqueuosine reductase QueH [bacterium]